jgi:hypothetical protein
MVLSIDEKSRKALPAPVRSTPNFLRHFRDREEAQLSQAFAHWAWWFDIGTFRRADEARQPPRRPRAATKLSILNGKMPGSIPAGPCDLRAGAPEAGRILGAD